MPMPMSNLFYAPSLQRACKVSKCPFLSFFYTLNITGMRDDDTVVLARPSHTRVHARWIPARLYACPLDPRTPGLFPMDPHACTHWAHARTHARMLQAHACTHAPGPCTHARTGSLLTHRVPMHARLLACRVPVPRLLTESLCPACSQGLHARMPLMRQVPAICASERLGAVGSVRSLYLWCDARLPNWADSVTRG